MPQKVLKTRPQVNETRQTGPWPTGCRDGAARRTAPRRVPKESPLGLSLIPLACRRAPRNYPGRVSPDRFVTDSSLELLARRLRMLGFDVLSIGDARLEQVFEAARRDGRTVLTLSARHPRRFASIPKLRIARGDPMGAVRAVALEFEPAGPPFGRCSMCNRVLEVRAAGLASGEAPEAVWRSVSKLNRCPGCGRWFWLGSHVDRIRAWLEQALGRPVPVPGLGPGPSQE